MINIPKGTKDILPIDSYKWQFVEKTARDVARRKYCPTVIKVFAILLPANK